MVWHQALLVFAQRYKLELDDTQRDRLRDLIRVKMHPQITIEIRRELFGRDPLVGKDRSAQHHLSAESEMETGAR